MSNVECPMINVKVKPTENKGRISNMMVIIEGAGYNIEQVKYREIDD